MKRSPRLRKVSFNLSDSVHQQLNMYALAASAAGVGILALTQGAEAKIVYTPAHVKIGVNSTIPLDLNHDGVTDFSFKNSTTVTSLGKVHGDILYAIPTGQGSRNEVWVGPNHLNSASDLPVGAVIRNNIRFRPRRHFMALSFYFTVGSCRGPWVNVKNRYLGLKFAFKGKTHFGWARLSVTCSVHDEDVTAILTGYAYETIPNKAIIAGKTKGQDERSKVDQPDPASLTPPTPNPATLGALAMGAPGLSIWRREELTSSQQ
jgi:hypothetical protein